MHQSNSENSQIVFRQIFLNENVQIDNEVIDLIRVEMNSDKNRDSFLSNIDYNSGSTYIVGGYIGDELACINLFIRMQFSFHDATAQPELQTIYGYQSGFSATKSKFRGKGLWTKLMKFSEELLKSAGGSFIFGFPNSVSYPLFVNKLNFQTVSMMKTIVPNIPMWSKFYLTNSKNTNSYKKTDKQKKITPVFYENLRWKKQESAANHDVKFYQFGQSAVWGKVRSRTKLGFKIHFFEVGGVDLKKHDDLKGLIDVVFDQLNLKLIYFSMSQDNDLAQLFKKTRPSPTVAIIKTLNPVLTERMTCHFMSGMADTF